MIEFVCPSCQSALRVGADTVGHVVRCGSCLATVRVPDVPPEPPPPRNPEPSRPPQEPVENRPVRRRSPPPKKTGRSPLFWILLGLIVLALIGAATCGGLVFMMQPKWQTHESPQGGFKVDLPGHPRPDMRDVAKMNNNADFQIEGTILALQGEGYGVMYRDIEPQLRRTHSDEKLMDEIVKGIQKDDPKIAVIRTTPMIVSGFPAREMVLSHPDEGRSIWRIVVADTRLYLVFAGGPKSNPEHNPRVRRFLDSFEVTDPVLRGRGKIKHMQPAPEPEPDDRDVSDVAVDFAKGTLQGAKRE